MKILKKKSKNTYVSKKTNKTNHFYNYFLELDNGKRIQIKVVYTNERAYLDALAEYEG